MRNRFQELNVKTAGWWESRDFEIWADSVLYQTPPTCTFALQHWFEHDGIRDSAQLCTQVCQGVRMCRGLKQATQTFTLTGGQSKWKEKETNCWNTEKKQRTMFIEDGFLTGKAVLSHQAALSMGLWSVFCQDVHLFCRGVIRPSSLLTYQLTPRGSLSISWQGRGGSRSAHLGQMTETKFSKSLNKFSFCF